MTKTFSWYFLKTCKKPKTEFFKKELFPQLFYSYYNARNIRTDYLTKHTVVFIKDIFNNNLSEKLDKSIQLIFSKNL